MCIRDRDWITLSQNGTLSAQPQVSEPSASRTFVVQVSGERSGVVSYGLVTVNTLAITATLFSDVTAPEGSGFDLNSFPEMPLLGTDTQRSWSLHPDVSSLPSWVTFTPAGLVSLRPGMNDEKIPLIFQQTASVNGAMQTLIVRVICEPVKFLNNVLADLSLISVEKPLSIDLSPLATGFVGTQIWAPAAGQSEAAMAGLTLSAAGILSISPQASPAMGRMLYVEVNNGSGTRRVGGIRFDLVAPEFVLGLSLIHISEPTRPY